jgi:hypothetical protein
MALSLVGRQYQVTVKCKARTPSSTVIIIQPGIFSVVVPGCLSVRLIEESRQIEITYAEFQRLRAQGALKRL